jgi:hypothetical protein
VGVIMRGVYLDGLVEGAERAIGLRGVVMLSLRGDDRCWCAICAAVDRSIELRVGEPARGWRRWRPAAGEAWLREHGFVHVLDAWAAPAPHGANARWCAEVLSSALREGLGAPENGELVETLVHPGLIGDAQPPAQFASHVEHVRYALTVLTAYRRGKVSIEGGRPATTWAWAFAQDGRLAVSPEPLDDRADYSRDWTVSFEDVDVGAEADKLMVVLYDDLGRSAHDPLFVSFVGL